MASEMITLLGEDYETKLQDLGQKYASLVSESSNREMRNLVDSGLGDLIDASKLPKDPLDREDAIDNLVKEVIKHFEEKMKSKELQPQLKRTVEGAVRAGIAIVLNDIPYLRYNGKKITYEDLKEDFDRKLVDIPEDKLYRETGERKSKRIKTSELREDFNRTLDNIDNVPQDIKTSIDDLIKEINLIYRNSGKEKGIKPSDLEFSITDVSLLKVFNTQSLNDFSKRGKTYEHWEEVHKGLTQLDVEIIKLKDILEEIDSDDVDFKKFVKVVDKEDFSVNYVEDFELQSIKLKEIDERAVDFLELFMRQNGFLSNVLDVGFDTIGEVINTEEGAIRISEADEELEEDTLSNEGQTKEYLDVIEEKHDMDALGILHFERNLNKLAVVSGESIVDLKNQIEAFLEDFKESPEIAVDDNYEDAMENFLAEIEELDDYKGGSTFLPIFMAKEEELETYYKLDVSGMKKNIQEFLLAFKNLTEGDEKSQGAKQIATGNLLGLGSGKTEMPRAGTQLFNFGRYLEGKQGSQRELRGKAKDMEDKLFSSFEEISELILENFSNQLYSEHLLGTDLPFRENIALRAISIRDFSDGKGPRKFNMFRELNKTFMLNQEAFITQEQIQDINKFLSLLSTGDSIANFSEIEKQAEVFYKVIDDVVENEEISKKAKIEIASILGSIWRYSNDTDKKFMGLSIRGSYNKVFVDEIKEINTLQVLADILKQNKSSLPTGKGMEDDLRRLFNNLDRVSKSVINKKILEAHDMLRILKSKEVIHSMKNENSYDDMENMITKMETQFNIDMSANEIIGVVKAVDSFEGIAKEYGIDAEHVYVLKANFR